VSQHKCIGGENRSRSRRGSVNGKEGADCGELAADFFFFNVEKASNVLNHLFVGKSHLIAGRTIWRRGGNDVRGVTDAIGGGRRARRDEDRGGQARHHWDGWAVVRYVEGKE